MLVKEIDNNVTLSPGQNFILMLDEAQAWAKSAGYVQEDINSIIKSVRAKKKHEHNY